MSPVDKVVYGKKKSSTRLQYPCDKQGYCNRVLDFFSRKQLCYVYGEKTLYGIDLYSTFWKVLAQILLVLKL